MISTFFLPYILIPRASHICHAQDRIPLFIQNAKRPATHIPQTVLHFFWTSIIIADTKSVVIELVV